MRALRMLAALAAMLPLWLSPALAADIVDDLAPPQKARYQSLIAELRCLVCQNQSLADSNADLAGDMREVVHRMIKEGRGDAEILKFMTDRYGDFVLYRPPLKPSTALLWALPFLVLPAALIAVIIAARRQTKTTTTLSATERQRAGELLGE